MSEDKPKVDLNVVQVVASALAAVSSAVLLSTVGVAGTIIGAAAGSVVATVGSAIYSYSLRVSRERVAVAAQIAAQVRVRRADGSTTQRLSTDDVARHAEHADDSERDADAERAARPSLRESIAHLSWKRIAAVTGAVFLAAMVVIVGFELVSGEQVSQLTGGTSKSDTSRTSIPGLGSSKSKAKQTPTKAPSASTSATPTGSSSATSTPTTAPSEPTTPSVSATPIPSTGATATPSATPTPTAAATPAG